MDDATATQIQTIKDNALRDKQAIDEQAAIDIRYLIDRAAADVKATAEAEIETLKKADDTANI